jgi:hypothetical protein
MIATAFVNIVSQVNEVVKNWAHYTKQTNVYPPLRDTINNTLINLNN